MRLLALIGVGIVGAGLAWPSTILLVADETGATLWRVPVAEGSAVVLRYTNSLYLAPVWERFEVRGGRLHLLEVSSTSEAVLDYNRLAPPYRRHGPRLAAAVSGVTLDVLPLRVGARGRPTLQVGDVTLPLYEAGVGTGLRVFVRRESRFLTWAAGLSR